eukprot:Gregarina_sp_Poly_1__80@NODE_1018_length_5347_cov_44_838447_g688_i1_p2_GENE_NODE_1018_length_5347_cov_44_838447_g688_i1NODE_1018_length_5347_cov_44_838447_g688_i1_p2_ORF_typecomplete_len457_score55_52_NODE_1018_length_5347_cov_44_838447_g688_i133134683
MRQVQMVEQRVPLSVLADQAPILPLTLSIEALRRVAQVEACRDFFVKDVSETASTEDCDAVDMRTRSVVSTSARFSTGPQGLKRRPASAPGLGPSIPAPKKRSVQEVKPLRSGRGKVRLPGPEWEQSIIRHNSALELIVSTGTRWNAAKGVGDNDEMSRMTHLLPLELTAIVERSERDEIALPEVPARRPQESDALDPQTSKANLLKAGLKVARNIIYENRWHSAERRDVKDGRPLDDWSTSPPSHVGIEILHATSVESAAFADPADNQSFQLSVESPLSSPLSFSSSFGGFDLEFQLSSFREPRIAPARCPRAEKEPCRLPLTRPTRNTPLYNGSSPRLFKNRGEPYSSRQHFWFRRSSRFLLAYLAMSCDCSKTLIIPITLKQGGLPFLLTYLCSQLLIHLPLIIFQLTFSQVLQKGFVETANGLHPRLRSIALFCLFFIPLANISYSVSIHWI